MILIIDDDSAVRSSLTFLLKHAGYETEAVTCPKEALDVVRNVAPQLILMDMNFTSYTANSPRCKEAFVKVNLGGLSQSLFESEMFGHKKGAFTDAYSDRVGRFELANKGTIFLDEIGDLELSGQVKLLRVLQDQTFEALGDSRQRKTDVRVVSATNRQLPEMVASLLL
jgi:DNA-binding NtrC family response regulator